MRCTTERNAEGVEFATDWSGCLHRVEARTGRVHWVSDLLAECTSPSLVEMPRPIYAAPNTLDLRTESHLFAVGSR